MKAQDTIPKRNMLNVYCISKQFFTTTMKQLMLHGWTKDSYYIFWPRNYCPIHCVTGIRLNSYMTPFSLHVSFLLLNRLVFPKSRSSRRDFELIRKTNLHRGRTSKKKRRRKQSSSPTTYGQTDHYLIDNQSENRTLKWREPINYLALCPTRVNVEREGDVKTT